MLYIIYNSIYTMYVIVTYKIYIIVVYSMIIWFKAVFFSRSIVQGQFFSD